MTNTRSTPTTSALPFEAIEAELMRLLARANETEKLWLDSQALLSSAASNDLYRKQGLAWGEFLEYLRSALPLKLVKNDGKEITVRTAIGLIDSSTTMLQYSENGGRTIGFNRTSLADVKTIQLIED